MVGQHGAEPTVDQLFPESLGQTIPTMVGQRGPEYSLLCLTPCRSRYGLSNLALPIGLRSVMFFVRGDQVES
jgi:hypothetical protein